MKRGRFHLSFTLFVAGIALAHPAWSQDDAGGSPTPVKARDIVGTWTLVSIEDRQANGEIVYWMGRNPTGMIIYDAQGNMSVQIAHDPRPIEPADYRDPPVPYYAYFGTYTFSESEAAVTHHVQGCTNPRDVGGNFKRLVRLDGDQLILHVKSKAAADPWNRILVWKRAT
jgi:hypothetical protein